MKTERLEFRLNSNDETSAVINKLIDKINELVIDVNYIYAKFSIAEEDDEPGEIGWDNGEFYK
jgi:hypothetical protein